MSATAQQLRNYANWLKMTPEEVIFTVIKLGGWKNIFENHVPVWASKVRNFFNVLPKTLKRLPDKNARDLLQRANAGPNLPFLLDCHDDQSYNRTYGDHKLGPNGRPKPPPIRVPASCPAVASHDIKHMGIKEVIVQKNALTKHVYTDECNRPWFQMTEESTIHHWGRKPFFEPLDAAYVDWVRGQNDTPVLKLISLDGTGGSMEVILVNDGYNAYAWGKGNEYIGEVNKPVNIEKIILHDSEFQGSYNYAETAQAGYASHKLRDVDPHVRGRTFYKNPRDMFRPLKLRSFEPNDVQGNPLVGQN